MSAPLPPTTHATTVAIGGRGVAIRGASGTGKSDLALRLIDRGAVLVADDRTILTRVGDHLEARCPPTIAGQMEVRGLGILPMPALAYAPLALLVDIGQEERIPAPRVERIDDIDVPVIMVDARAPSAPIKVERALANLCGALP